MGDKFAWSHKNEKGDNFFFIGAIYTQIIEMIHDAPWKHC